MNDTIWNKQLDLTSQGLYGHIWRMSDCNEVIDTLCNEHRVILGGEILKLKNNGEYVYDGSSWYYNGDSYVDSSEVAKKYFSTWNPTEDMAVIFVFKPDKHN